MINMLRDVQEKKEFMKLGKKNLGMHGSVHKNCYKGYER